VIVIPLRIKVQLTAAIIATLLLPFPAGADPYKVPYCIGGDQTIRQVDASTIICRNLTPKSTEKDELYLYRWHGEDLETSMSIVVFSGGRKLVTIITGRNRPGVNALATQFRLIGRSFDEWGDYVNPDLLEQRRSDVTLLLDTLESAPLSRPIF